MGTITREDWKDEIQGSNKQLKIRNKENKKFHFLKVGE